MTAGCFALVAAWTFAATPQPPRPSQALDVEPEELQAGLVAQYRWGHGQANLSRVDPKLAFFLAESSPHPRIPAGPFEVQWDGVLLIHETGPISFDAWLCGELTLEVDGVRVCAGRGEDAAARVEPNEKLDRRPGVYRLRARYRSLAGKPARLQVWWQGMSFAREPLPAWRLKHLATQETPVLRSEQQVDAGRAAVEQLGCARCHGSGLPGASGPPPGPAIHDIGRRASRSWLADWLDHPSRVRPGARMPRLFASDRSGFVERWIVAEYLAGRPAGNEPAPDKPGDHRMGRRHFVSIGCAACHFLPDLERAQQPDLGQTAFAGLGDRLPAGALSAFLEDPRARYPDGRMPRLGLSPDAARDIAAYLLLWSKPPHGFGAETAAARRDGGAATADVPTPDELAAVQRRFAARDPSATALALVREKRCGACHPGAELEGGVPTPAQTAAIPIPGDAARRGCLAAEHRPAFEVDTATRHAIAAYRAVAEHETHQSESAARGQALARFGCVRCHQRDSDRPPPLEQIGSTLGGAWLQNVPYQRTPRLSYAHQKYTSDHLLAAVREGVSGLRHARYSYRMPAFDGDAGLIVRALAEADGELPDSPATQATGTSGLDPVADPTWGTLHGPALVGFQGYACVSCHVWNGQALADPDPGAVGPDLTRLVGRIRSDWFGRFLENPQRFHPGTPMPSVFPRGQPATLRSVLDGDSARQRSALWSYFALGKGAPSPKPAPPLPLGGPPAGQPPRVAQIPLHLPAGGVIESICLLTDSHDLVVYDVGRTSLHSIWSGAQILRSVQGRIRTNAPGGTLVASGFPSEPAIALRRGDGDPERPATVAFNGYDRLDGAVTIRTQAEFAAGRVQIAETLRVQTGPTGRTLVCDRRVHGIPADCRVEFRSLVPAGLAPAVVTAAGPVDSAVSGQVLTVRAAPDVHGSAQFAVSWALGVAQSPAPYERTLVADPAPAAGSLVRPGYRAIAYARPKTVSGEDRVMPSAVAVHPRDGRVFVASMKTGEILVLRDPAGDGSTARFDDYARGLFQEAYSMLADDDALYVLHRRNLTRVVDRDGDGFADRFDRVVGLPHSVADSYDYGYGLTRDRSGAFVVSYAPYASTHLSGSGGAVRLVPGQPAAEVAYGFRNPVGWCAGPDREIFWTDNQGEWVATNKLCHLTPGRFFGFPNPAQKHHASRPRGKTAVWVPYAWAHSVNGVAYDHTGGKFGPFAGQLFLAELMFGGSIVRASLEKVNGEYQGACFPFWGKGLLGPLTLAFDPRGPLYVGGITEPGWMAQPDRGALFRIDFTGVMPFEMESIQVRSRGFEIVFTKPVRRESAADAAAYHVEHYRYEYTGAYGSPELDRTTVPVEQVTVSADGRRVQLTTTPLVTDRVYMITAAGVRSADGQALVYPTGAYTLNEVPR
jgi:mono/diheme cytochrome c family protein/glucose/arabinose dehydrogenase